MAVRRENAAAPVGGNVPRERMSASIEQSPLPSTCIISSRACLIPFRGFSTQLRFVVEQRQQKALVESLIAIVHPKRGSVNEHLRRRDQVRKAIHSAVCIKFATWACSFMSLTYIIHAPTLAYRTDGRAESLTVAR